MRSSRRKSRLEAHDQEHAGRLAEAPDILSAPRGDLLRARSRPTNANVRKLDEPIYQAQQQKNKEKFKQLQDQQKQLEKKNEEYRKEAIKTYAPLVQDHPNYKRMDEVLFSLGFSLDEMKQYDKAREVYHRLIKNFPAEQVRPQRVPVVRGVLLPAGRHDRRHQSSTEGHGVPARAQQGLWLRALQAGLVSTTTWRTSRVRLQNFVEVIEFGKSNPEGRDVANLVKQSRHELVMPYAQVGTPGKALEFFRRFAKDDDSGLRHARELGRALLRHRRVGRDRLRSITS